jgi:hypothetical protein
MKHINHLQNVGSSNWWVKNISRHVSWMSACGHTVIWCSFLYATVYMWLWWVCSNCCLIYGFTNANVMHALCDFLSVIPNWSVPIDPLLEVARTSRLIHSGWACELSKYGTHFVSKPTDINTHKIFIKVSLSVFRGLISRGAQMLQKFSSHLKILSASGSA